MDQLIPVIDQVLESITQGQILVSDVEEMRETLLFLRSLASDEVTLQGHLPADGIPPAK